MKTLIGMMSSLSLLLASQLAVATATAPAEKIIGVGMVLVKNSDSGQVFVKELVEGAPADKSGIIQPDMVLEGVFDIEAQDWRMSVDSTLEEIVGLIRGPVGTTVKLLFQSPEGTGDYIVVELIREEFETAP